MSSTISSPPPPSNQNLKNRTIFTRDCLEVMRGMKDECIDLIYLDPPFNSNANYAAPIGSRSLNARGYWMSTNKTEIDDLEIVTRGHNKFIIAMWKNLLL